MSMTCPAAETDREAQRLFTSLLQQFIALRRGSPGPLPPPLETMEGYWSPQESAAMRKNGRHPAPSSAGPS